jgi:hypothetical protein
MILEKIRKKIAMKLIQKEAAKLLRKELGEIAFIKLNEKKKKVSSEQDSTKKFAKWIVQGEGKSINDLEFFYALLEQVLIKLDKGELTREEIARIFTPTYFRTKRFVEQKDEDLEVKLAEMNEKNEDQPEEFVQQNISPSFLKTLFDKAENVAKESLKNTIHRKQFLSEQKRIESMNRAVLANSPEFLESLTPDYFKSERLQKRQEKQLFKKETMKIRGRLVKETIPFKTEKEKTPKEITEEKRRIIQKLRQELGGKISSST